MACPFCGNNNRQCLRQSAVRNNFCNTPCSPGGSTGINRCSNAGATAALEAEKTMARARASANNCPCDSASATGGNQCLPAAHQLYSGSQSTGAAYAICCDPGCPCKQYDLDRRCTFWPSFAHPRWLSCRQLYSRKIRR